ncbi:Zn(2)-C6 fungal-type domain-containing protein [[Candida] zeylanoides]
MTETNKRHKSDSSRNRKSAQINRTMMACELCRKQKTRCFRDPDNVACMRCIFMKTRCSFEHDALAISTGSYNGGPVVPTTFSLGPDMKSDKLDQIQRSLMEVLAILKAPMGSRNGHSDLAKGSLTNYAAGSDVKGSMADSQVGTKFMDEGSKFETPTTSFLASPFSIVANQLVLESVPTPISGLLGLNKSSARSAKPRFNDVISKGIISEANAISLMNVFRRNYGRWISLPPNMSTTVLISRIRHKSSLLLTTCYCLALRFSLNGVFDPKLVEERQAMHRVLTKQLETEMGEAFVKVTCFGGCESGHIEFLQALVLVSIYSLSISSLARHSRIGTDECEDDQLTLDPWLISGMGLQLFVTKSTLGTLLSGALSKSNHEGDDPHSPFTVFFSEFDSEEFQKLAVLRTYNHLTLVHLINCVFSGRMCAIDAIRLKYSTATLSLPSSTNFDGRMVSEIGILLVAYNYVQKTLLSSSSESDTDCEMSFKQVKEEIRSWYEQWEYLFSQPAPQFVELCYHFCCITIYYAYTYQKTIINGDTDTHAGSGVLCEPVTTESYREDKIVFLLKNADDVTLGKILMHAINLVRFINVIESDSYFAYLSDQIHFCFFYAATILLKLLRWGNDRNLFDEREVLEIKGDLTLLISKFQMMSSSTNSHDDLTSRYCKALQSGFAECFANTVD